MKRVVLTSLLLMAGCNNLGFVLPTLDGIWDIPLDENGNGIAILVENGVITQYDQGTGEFDELQSQGSISQSGGIVSFRVQALQTFVDLNDSRPAEFVVTGEGPVQEDGSIRIFLRFSMVDGDAEGGLDAIMRRR
ncbi:MAG: hypothetical protein MI923_30715 [Phycisphaerales bacterium]|nr:hypothetical protein [Phycisphaerales bacterium]